MARGSAQRGPIGETIAAVYLRRLGYRVVDRNVRTRRGEIDLVARHGEELVFVEVKSWRRLPAEGLEHAIDRRKQRRMVSVARAYLTRNFSRYAIIAAAVRRHPGARRQRRAAHRGSVRRVSGALDTRRLAEYRRKLRDPHYLAYALVQVASVLVDILVPGDRPPIRRNGRQGD